MLFHLYVLYDKCSKLFSDYPGTGMTHTGKRRRRTTRAKSRSSAAELSRDIQVGVTTRIHEQEYPDLLD